MVAAVVFRRRRRGGGGGTDAPSAAALPHRRPRVSITRFDVAPPEVDAQTPLDGELLHVIPGPDRPDYVAVLLDKPVYFRPPPELTVARIGPGKVVTDADGYPVVRVNSIVVCARIVGDQITPASADLPVDVAFVVDDTALRDEVLDLTKLHVVGHGSFDHLPPEPERETLGPLETGPLWTAMAGELHQGISSARGAMVEQMDVNVSFDDQQRVSSLSGIADGLPVMPPMETIERMNEHAVRLIVLAPLHRPASVRILTEGTKASFEIGYRDPPAGGDQPS